MPKRDQGVIDFVRAYTSRIYEVEENLSELQREGEHFAKNLPETLSKIERLEQTIADADKELETLRVRREQLQREYVGATFNEDAQAQKEIIQERRELDQRIQSLTNERDTASTNLNRLNSSLQTTRQDAFGALVSNALPDEQVFLDEFVKRLREQRQQLEDRMAAAELLYLLPHETEARKKQEREAERAANATRIAQEKQERADRRKVLSRLLSRESVAEPRRGQRPRRGSEGWQREAEARDIPLPRYDNLPVTDNEFRLYSEVAAEYEALRRADGLPVEETQQQPQEPSMTRSNFISVM
jgi:chromosome segregation ATPase